ncbi:hypothetical protein T492DRAFT_1011696 [Pavlovales sp. CCMP2436]|nr:hypothetical protein T492DRAFT_1011696 [Pavlovales sp. CCMP2436]
MVKSAIWGTAHTSLGTAEVRQLEAVQLLELTRAVNGGEVITARARALATTGGCLPPYPTVHSSLYGHDWARDHLVKYTALATSGPDEARAIAAGESRPPARKKRELPMRGPINPSYRTVGNPSYQPPEHGVTSSSAIGGHMQGVYRDMNYDINLATARGQGMLDCLRAHDKTMPFVPSIHTAAAPVPFYSLPYRAELEHRPMLESGSVGRFYHEPSV